MQIHYLQHVWFEDLGAIQDWADANNHSVTKTALHKNEKLPLTEDFDMLVVMGGPMGVHDDNKYPWLTQEKKFIEQALKQNKKILGICLGAQLIAHVLGAKIYKNKHKEIGWFQVQKINNHSLFPPEFTPFHWHGDTFDIPSDALPLAKTQACLHQAFSWNNHQAIGLQFHLEAKPINIQNLIAQCPQDLSPAPFVQSAAHILSDNAHHISCQSIMSDLLSLICHSPA